MLNDVWMIKLFKDLNLSPHFVKLLQSSFLAAFPLLLIDVNCFYRNSFSVVVVHTLIDLSIGSLTYDLPSNPLNLGYRRL